MICLGISRLLELLQAHLGSRVTSWTSWSFLLVNKIGGVAGVCVLVLIRDRLWCGCENGEVIVWNNQDSQEMRLKHHSARVGAIASVGPQVIEPRSHSIVPSIILVVLYVSPNSINNLVFF